MSFSADTIGFYLQAEDKLTPTLSDATDSYRKFVKDLEKLNKTAYKTVSSGIGSLSNLVNAFETLPSKAISSYKEAMTALRSRIKPITQPINIVFSPKSKREISQAVGQAVMRAMSGTKIRLQPTFPKQPLGIFDTSIALRSLYHKLAQPPDMKGKLEPKRFKAGGLVEGGKAGKDSVLSLLEPGEFVLSKDMLAQLGKMHDQAGKFISAKPYADSLAKINALGNALEKLKVALDAGFDDPKAIKMFDNGMKELGEEVTNLVKISGSLSYQMQVRLAPAVKDVRGRMADLRGEAKETGKVTNNLLEKILGPAKFLAISAAAQHVVDGLSKLKDGGSQAFDALGGEQIESFTTNMNQMNSRLNLSRAGLREFKAAAADVADLKDLNINEMSEAMEGMVEAGLRDKTMLLKLAPAATSFSKASRVSFDVSGKAAYKMADAYGFTEDQIAATFDNISMFQSNSAANAETLTSDMLETMASLGPALLKESTSDQQAILSNFARLGASLADTWAGETGSLQGMLGKAMGGEVDSMQKVSMIFGKTQDELKESFKSGDLTGLLDGLATQIQQLTSTGNVAGLDALRQAMGFEGTAEQFGMLGKNIGKVDASLDKLGKMQHTVADMGTAQAELTKRADANRTAYEQLQTTFGQLAAKDIPGLGVSLGQIIDLGKEFNVTTLISIGYLAKMGVEAGVGAVKGLLTLGSGLGSVLKSMGMFGGAAAKTAEAAASTASAAGGAVGAGGFFAGLSAGMEALAVGIGTLGTVLLSPPGIAFTVSLVVAMLALGGALRLAAPAIATFGEVAIAAIGKAVEAFGMLVPVLLQMVDVGGKVLMGAIDGIVTVFKTLFTADPTQLLTIGPALFTVAAGLGAVATASAALAAVQIGQGILSFITGGPSDVSGGVFSLLASMIGSIRNLKVATPEAVAALTATVNGLGGFALSYARLTNTLGDLPSDADLGPRMKNLAGAFTQATQASALQQARTTNAIAPSQLQAVVDAISHNPVMDEMCAAAERSNDLLAKILQALSGGALQSAATAPPQLAQAGPSLPNASSLTRDIAGFGH